MRCSLFDKQNIICFQFNFCLIDNMCRRTTEHIYYFHVFMRMLRDIYKSRLFHNIDHSPFANHLVRIYDRTSFFYHIRRQHIFLIFNKFFFLTIYLFQIFQ